MERAVGGADGGQVGGVAVEGFIAELEAGGGRQGQGTGSTGLPTLQRWLPTL